MDLGVSGPGVFSWRDGQILVVEMNDPISKPVVNENLVMVKKLIIIVVAMFGFGYALVPIYKKLCEVTGINILSLQEANAVPGKKSASVANTQVDQTRTITVEFDSNAQGPWRFLPAKRSVQVHPGELVTIMYELANQQPRTIAGQAIPSYAPMQSAAHFNKFECFCFLQQTLGPNEVKQFPVVFVVDKDLPKDVHNITLSYTFFEVAGRSAEVSKQEKGSDG
jgi:cytochrome c oxidase assembly protein subunit 11